MNRSHVGCISNDALATVHSQGKLAISVRLRLVSFSRRAGTGPSLRKRCARAA
jgi:hypothetical protein